MDQFVLVLASVYNKSFITQLVTKQALTKYQPSQNPTYQIDSFKKEINEILFSKADSLVDKILSCPRIKLSNSQNLILDGVETGIFLSNFAQQLRRKNADVPDIYFTLLDAAGISPTLILNQNAKAKERGISDLIEYNIDGDTKAPLLRCCLFISQLNSGDIITTGQYMNYQTFSNLQLRPLLKNSFHSIHINLRDTSGEKIPFVSVGITCLVLMFRKASNDHF